MADTYCFLHLDGGSRKMAELADAVRAEVLPEWRAAGIVPWGLWAGLFGVSSNELIVVAAAAGDTSLEAFTAPAARAAGVKRAELLEPTIRPVELAPRERPGLYVFRFFTVAADAVDEFVELSGQAWGTFEGADSYAAEPQGLFRQKDRSQPMQDMLLATWYDSLDSWQTSRDPAPEARERFARRYQLTYSTLALATRLLADA